MSARGVERRYSDRSRRRQPRRSPNASLSTSDQFQASHAEIAPAVEPAARTGRTVEVLAQSSRSEEFFDAHPDIREDMARNPGDYLAVVPGAESRLTRVTIVTAL